MKRTSLLLIGRYSKLIAPMALCLLSGVGAYCQADSGLEKKATWIWPSSDQLNSEFSNYLNSSNVASADISAQAIRSWNDSSSTAKGPQLLEDWVHIMADVNQPLAQWLTQLGSGVEVKKSGEVRAEFEQMSKDLPTYFQNNLRLFVGRYLTQRHFYDEAIDVMEPLTLEQVVDPSTLLFCRATAYHHLLRRDDCISTIDTLLQREGELVSRYAVLAKLMKADIQPMEQDSLDEIARLMKDVQRRLDLERSGKVVRDQEDSIVEKLDKKIDEIEEQLQQQQQQMQMAQQSKGDQQKQSQGSPMQDSMIAGDSGPGNVDKKDIGKLSGWGDLPPAQRQEALQKMTQDLPSHYREIIEAYFKRLASEGQ
jgi:hypothetical protein